jgi:uncharacterized protein (TIGR03435 family)
MIIAMAPQTLQFDVASVRPSRSDGISEFQIQGNRLVISGMSVKDLVRRVYMTSDAPQDGTRVVGGPGWASTDLYDIVAESDDNPGVDQQGRPMRLLAMLKTLLEDRFKLRVRTESRETSIYELVTTGGDGVRAARLHPSVRHCPVYAQGVPRPAVTPAERCGLTTVANGSTVTVTAQGITMSELATRFQGFRSVGRPVQNKTGLDGRYDFTLEFTTPAAAPASDALAAPLVETGPSLFTVLQDQLGLKLQATQAPMDFYVIESVQRPTAN